MIEKNNLKKMGTKLSNQDQMEVSASEKERTWVFQDLLSQDPKDCDKSLDSKRNDK